MNKTLRVVKDLQNGSQVMNSRVSTLKNQIPQIAKIKKEVIV